MKKLMSVLLGLSLTIGLATAAFGQEQKEEKKEGKKKGKKKKAEEPK
jgi:hypothetical protein